MRSGISLRAVRATDGRLRNKNNEKHWGFFKNCLRRTESARTCIKREYLVQVCPGRGGMI